MKSYKNTTPWIWAEQNLSAESLAVINIFAQLKTNELPVHYFAGFETALETARIEGMIIVKLNGQVKLLQRAKRKLVEFLEVARNSGHIE